MIRKSLFALLFIFSGLNAVAEEPIIQSHLISEQQVIAPGQEFQLLLNLQLAPEWHAYWKNPGDAGMAPDIKWTLSQGIEVVSVDWPTPERYEMGEVVTFGYEDEVPFLVTFHADSSLMAKEVRIDAEIQSVVCSKENCVPGSANASLSLPVGKIAEAAAGQKALFQKLRDELPKKIQPTSVKQKDDQLLLNFYLENLEISEGTVIQFFPEEKSGIDHHRPANVTSGSKPGELILGLKSSGTSASQLKGVLVVGDRSYDLDTAYLPKAEMLQGSRQPPASEESGLSFEIALFFAFLGGLILNLMPCVLPVVSLKIMSFVQMAGKSRFAVFQHGLFFTLGVMASFWVLAGLLLLLQSSGAAVGWGFQLQEPLFIAALTLLFTLMGLSLFGVFELGTSVANLAGSATQNARKQGLTSSFANGVFATAVATPCTGPFMGSALGYAVTQPAYVSFAIFTALGLGMSLPYLVLGAFPKLIRWMPKPGVWMESFKQFLGFLMMASVIWLLWVFMGQTSEMGLFFLLFALFFVSLGAWIYGRWSTPLRSKRVRVVSALLMVSCLLGAFYFIKRGSASVDTPAQAVAFGWEPFSRERLQELRAKNTPVLIDFTAKWCLICQANHLVLNQNEVAKKLDELGVVRMKADWTRRDPVITEELVKYGRNGVPLYLLYGEKGEPKILPQVLTPDSVIGSLEELSQGKNVR